MATDNFAITRGTSRSRENSEFMPGETSPLSDAANRDVVKLILRADRSDESKNKSYDGILKILFYKGVAETVINVTRSQLKDDIKRSNVEFEFTEKEFRRT